MIYAALAIAMHLCVSYDYFVSTHRYEVLLQCWKLSPNDRPSFSVLAQVFSELLLPTEYVNIKNSGTE